MRTSPTRVAIAFCALMVVPLHGALAHPIHMSFTELRFAGRSGAVDVSVRVFANDFSAAAARRSRVRLGPDSLIDSRNGVSYLVENVRLSLQDGRSIRLVSCGVTRAGDMLRFCFRARLPSADSRVQISNSLMTELFSDQVNVVQSVIGSRRASRMFVRGDRWKPVL